MYQLSKGDFLKVKRLLAWLACRKCASDVKEREIARRASLLLKKFNRKDETD